jgi:general secretion pathway protein K
MTSNKAGFSRSKGSALLAVLWLSAALAAVALSVAATVRSETERVSASAEGVRAHFLATGSIDRALLWMFWGLYGGYANPDGSPRYYRPPMSRLRFPYPSGEALVEVMPETSKLNVNLASAEDLYRLLLIVGAREDQAREISAAIIDWRSPTPGPTLFDQQYLSVNPTFRARHASLEEIEELLLVRGMTPELFYGTVSQDEQGRLLPRGGLKDCLSIYGSIGAFDVNTADATLLLWLGLSPETVRLIVERRNVRPFAGGADLGELGHPRLSVGGNTIWTLRATAHLRRADGSYSELKKTVSATVKFLDPNKWDPAYHILRWYDDAWSPSAAMASSPPSAPAPVSNPAAAVSLQ